MNVQELLERAGIQPKKVSNTKGGEYHSPCPGCGGEDRFHVWPEQNHGKGSYWCRSCGKGGDNIQFLIDFENLSFVEACEQLGRPLPESRALKTPTFPQNKKAFEPSVYSDPDNTWCTRAGKFVEWSHNHLMQLPDQLAWLAQRGISAETAKRFQLGWNPGEKEKDIYRPRETWGLTPETKEDGKPRKLWIPIGLVIPNFAADNVTRIRIRRPDPITFGPRYYVLPGSSMATMRIPCAADGGDRFSWSVYVIVEAELDAIAVWQAAGKASGVVATGSAQTKPDQETFKVLDNCNIILNALDFDKAGATAAWNWWAATFPHSERWPVPEGKDPGEAYKAGVDLRTWVLSGLPSFDSNRRPASPEASGEKQKAPAYGDDAVLSNLIKSVAELYELLKTSPARIKKAGDNIHAEINKEWEKKNWTASKRISDLVFMDPDVGQYLNLHPASNITAKNFLSIAVILKLDGEVTT
jgi:hypothetical protein